MWLKNVLLGISIAALIHLMLGSSCMEQINDPEDVNQNEKSVIEGMKKAGDAFLSGDTTQLKTVLTNDALKFYSDDFSNIMQVMKEIGSAMKESRVVTLATNYAEVEIDYQGGKFNVLMALQDDESWKIIRF